MSTAAMTRYCSECQQPIRYAASPEPYWIQAWVKGCSGGEAPHYFMNQEPAVLCSKDCARRWFEKAIAP